MGAAGTVTGSKHLLKTGDINILIDCGLFQGLKNLREKNWEKLPIDPSSIDVLLLSHAHLDHCGYIPLFVKNGFKGKIYMTPPTSELAQLILRDSAKIQEEDAEKANKGKYSKHTPALPLYKIEDVDHAVDLFETVDHSVTIKLSTNISFQFKKNGHILGSCCIELICFEKTIIFSGDIGRYNSKFLMPPEDIQGADFVVMESTYGGKLHPAEDTSIQLEIIINRTIQRNGNILIPSFAVGRAQEIMHLINQLKLSGRIPKNLSVYLDSPMAATATEMLCKYSDWHRLNETDCIQMVHDVVINRNAHNTRKILTDGAVKIVISASGMLTGGRVLEYLKQYIVNPLDTILLIGYQAEGTRGRALHNKVHELRIHGQFFPVKAEVAEINGLSGHADESELIRWLKSFRKLPEKIFLVHGDPGPLDALRIKIINDFKIDVQIQVEDKETILFTTTIN